MSLNIIQAKDFCRKKTSLSEKVLKTCQSIIDDVRTDGDTAVNLWSERIDGFKPRWIELKTFENYELDEELKNALLFASQRIERFAEFQMSQYRPQSYSDEFGEFGFNYQPLQSMAAYIPAGAYPLVSSALMTLIPARVAGCDMRTACSPSDAPEILAAASLAGAQRFLHIGGAQAVAAMSYGYDTQAPVDMIVGPGNAFVNTAKSLLMSRTGIDSLAGPSEVLIYANQLNQPQWIIADALAQSEHDLNARSLIVSCNTELLENLRNEILKNNQAVELVENNQIELINCRGPAEATNFINDYAPEHLLICDESADFSEFKNYGALFIGERSAVAFGDYCSGPNHTLPTDGAARRMSGLGVHSFLKIQTQQKISSCEKHKLSKCASVLANCEGLSHHKNSVLIRRSSFG